MNYQPLIDNLPYILLGVGLVLWALARLAEAKAKANPDHDRWDDAAPKLIWASKMYSQALDWLVESGHIKWSGKEKLAQLRVKVAEFEKQVTAGNYLEAVSEVIGFVQDAQGKAKKAGLPSNPTDTTPPTTP